MLFFCLYLLSMLVSNRGLVLSGRVYHIIPSLSDVCPQDPCLTPYQFAENSSIYIDTNTAVTLIFTPSGVHSFNYGSLVFIENVGTFSLFSNQTSTVVSSLWIGFISVANVFIDNLTFVRCNFHFDRVETLVVENSVFLNNTHTLMELERSTNAYVANSQFISNSGGPAHLTCINGSSRSYYTGAVVIMRSSSTLVCKRCLFHQNIAEVGGVVYARLFSNLTFINCNFVSNHACKFGGVFYIKNFCTVRIENSSFHSNSASSMAGVLAAANSNNVEILCSTFTNNIAGRNGGMLHTNNSRITISESMFSNCSAYNYGGVIASFGSTILIQESVFHHNKVDAHGGVIYAIKQNQGGYIRITESDFVNNSAEYGGVLLSEGTSVSFIDCRRIESNRAGMGGVMLTVDVYQTIISGCVLYNNTAELAGGALMFSSDPIVNISHSQLIGNSADEGGAVFVEDQSNLSINNCNFDSNRATEIGGAISVQIMCHFVIATSLIRNNSAQYGAGIFFGDKSSVTINNIIVTQNSATKQGTLFLVESIVTFTNISVSDNAGSLFFFYSNVAFRDTTVIDSGTSNKLELTTMEGGAVTAFLSIVDLEDLIMLRYNSASKGGAIHAISSKLYIRGNILVSNNSALVSGGGIYLYQSELDCLGQSSLELLGNKAMDRGGGIHAINGRI